MISTRIERRLAAKSAKKNFIKNNWGEWEHRIKPRYDSGTLPIPAPNGLVQAWCNGIFAVQEYDKGGWLYLMIRRHDQKPIGWAEMQRIKNELYDPETIGIQVFPRESKLINDCNMYWMFLVPDTERTTFESNLVYL